VFIGHFALGFAAKRAAPKTSLALLFVAAQLADLLWPALLAVGLEQVRIDPGNTAFTPLDFVSYPYSHSLALLAAWAVLLALVVRSAPLVVALLVVSHWLLDWMTHRPDMPLYPDGPRYGLGLWNSIPATVAIELAMFAAGVWMYARSTRPRDAAGRWGFVTFVAFLLVAYATNVVGPPPPSVTAIWIASITGAAILLAWSWWLDRHRSARSINA
jgi:hypothetical protein